MVALSAAIMVRYRQGNQSQAATLCYGWVKKHPPDERKEGLPMYVTYSDLIQIGIFIVALVGLIYEIFKGRK